MSAIATLNIPAFGQRWDEHNGTESRGANPRVWCIEFKAVQP